MMPKNPGTIQKDTQKSANTPEKVPKIMAHPHITTYANILQNFQQMYSLFFFFLIGVAFGQNFSDFLGRSWQGI